MKHKLKLVRLKLNFHNTKLFWVTYVPVVIELGKVFYFSTV